MWIGLNDGWLSIVENRNDEDTLLVRARCVTDLTNAFPHCDWFEDKNADYQYRAYINRKEVAKQIADRILNIDYPNFKASVMRLHLKQLYDNLWRSVYLHYQLIPKPALTSLDSLYSIPRRDD